MADVREAPSDYRDRRSATDPGDRSAAEIEREVDAERARVAETIDALQEKASVGNVIDQVVRSVGPYGADFGRNLGRQVRDNPLPLMLTGVGLAWLMAASNAPRRERRDWEDDDYDADYDRSYASGYDGDAEVGYRPASASATPVYPEADWDTAGDEDTESGISERMRHAREGVAGAAGRASATMRGAGSRASHAMHGAGSAVRGAGSAVRGAGGSAWRSAEDLGRSAWRGGRSVQDGFDRMLEDQPLVVGALAFALGAALGGVLPRSRTEDDLFGERSDQVKEHVREAAAEQGRKLQASAGAVADEAARFVEEKVGEADDAVSRDKAFAGAGEPTAADEEANRPDLGQPRPPL